VRPLWRAGAFSARVAGGALVRGPAGEAWIDGRQADALVRWLAARLDGSETLADLVAGLDAGQGRAVAGVVEHLVERGAVVDVDAGAAPPGPGGLAAVAAIRVDGLVVDVRDVVDPRRDVRLHRAFTRRGVGWLPVRGGPGEVWIGPRSGRGPGCVECLRLRRLAARSDGWAVRRIERLAALHARSSRAAYDPAVGSAVRDAVRAWTELDERPGLRPVVRLPLREATPLTAWLAPVPGCPACGGPPGAGSGRELRGADLAAPQAPLPLDLVERLVDGRVGLVGGCRTRGAVPATAEAVVHVPEGRRRREEWGLGCAGGPREAAALAALEALERSCAAPRGRTVERASATELGDRAIDPRRLVLHSDEQYARPGFPFARAGAGEVQEWTWAYSLAEDRHVALPADLVFYRGRRRPPGRKPLACNSSSGCAIGSTAGQAALHALLEVLERDALLLTWYGRRPPCRLDLGRAEDRRIAALAAELDARGCDVAVFDTTPPEIGVPCVWAMAVSRSDTAGLRTLSGASCHPDPERAVLKALREVAGHLLPMRELAASAGSRAQRLLAGGPALRRPRDHVLLYGLPEAFDRLRFLFEGDRSDLAPRRHFKRRGAEVVTEPAAWAPAVHAAVLRAGLDVLVADMTASDVRALGLVAVRVLVPGALPMTFGAGLERTAGASRLSAPPGPPLPHPLG
jgi:ribosomal protein S12 methylthiotransferase accessory factor